MGAPLKSDAGRTSFMRCEMFGLPCWCRVLRLFDVFSLQLVARETWSDSSDFPDWTLSDINHDHSTMNLVALQKHWEQNRSDVSKAHTTWFDSIGIALLWVDPTYMQAISWHLGNDGSTGTWPQNVRGCTQVRWKLRCNFQIASCLMPHLCHVVQLPLAGHFAIPLVLGLKGSHWPFIADTWPHWKNNLPSIGQVWIPVACCNLYIYIIYFFFKKSIVLWILPGCDFSLGISWGQKGMINQLQVEACLIYKTYLRWWDSVALVWVAVGLSFDARRGLLWVPQW